MNQIKNVCVYCASSTKIDEKYFKIATHLGLLFAQHHIRLLNGGGRFGLMAAVADSILMNGGEAVGIIPQFMIDQGWNHASMTKMIVVKDMHERKYLMAEKSDATIALPGGCGTLDELLELITLKQLGLYLNPIVILNIDGYFDPLLSMFQKAVDEHFMGVKHADLWNVATTPKEAVEMIYNTPLWESSFTKFAVI